MFYLIEFILTFLDDVSIGVSWSRDCPTSSFGLFFETEAPAHHAHDSAVIARHNSNSHTHFDAYVRYSMGYRTHEEYSILYPLYGTGLRTRFFVDLVMNFNISNNILVISEYHLSDDPHDDSGISNGGAIRVYG